MELASSAKQIDQKSGQDYPSHPLAGTWEVDLAPHSNLKGNFSISEWVTVIHNTLEVILVESYGQVLIHAPQP